jgi:hypothetical protein
MDAKERKFRTNGKRRGMDAKKRILRMSDMAQL